MTEFANGGGEDEKNDDEGPLGAIGKSVARRRQRLEREYDRLLARRGRTPRTQRDLERWQDEQNELLNLEGQLGKSGRDPYADAQAEGAYNPEDAVPSWLRKQWEAQARAAGGAVIGLSEQGEAPLPDTAVDSQNAGSSI